MKRYNFFMLCTALLGTILLRGTCSSELPFQDITYNAEIGWTVKGGKYETGKVYATDKIVLFKDGIGTVVIMDTMRWSGGNVPTNLESLASIPATEFLTYPLGQYNICMLSSVTGKTWCVDLNQCKEMFLQYNKVPQTVTLFADLTCPGIIRPQ